MHTAKVFRIGRDQAIRIPREYHFRAKELIVNRVGDLVVMFPREKGWRILQQGLRRFTDDFLAERNQPAEPEERDGL